MNVPSPRQKRLPFTRFAAPLALAAASAFIFLSSGDLDGDYLPQRRQLKSSLDANAQTAESRKSYPVDFRADLTTNLESIHTGPTQEGSTSTPYFWHIPKAGGEIILSHYVSCRGLKVGHCDDSIDVVSRAGVIKAREGGLVPSHEMDMLLSPLFHPVVDLFDADNRGRAFAMFRHPVDNIVSAYYHHLQYDTWDPAIDPKLAETPIVDFAKVGHRRDWMTRNLVGISWEDEITEEDFDDAKQILGDYFLVGLTSKADESTERFDKFFGVPVPTDQQLLANCGGKDSQAVATRKRGSLTFNAIAETQQWDVKLYEFVEALYVDQARFFGEEAKQEASPPLQEVAPVAVVEEVVVVEEAVPVPPQAEAPPAEVAESSIVVAAPEAEVAVMSAPSSEGSFGSEIFLHFSKVSTPIVATETPVFFHVPRAGTSTKWILGGCLGLTMATDAGTKDGHDQDEALQVVTSAEGGRHVNVDTTTIEGIRRAAQMGLIHSHLAHVVVTPHLFQASSMMFDSDHMARMFTMLRHPIHLFDVEAYANENNWMVRFLTGEMHGTLNDHHLHVAKEILRDYALVGLTDKKEESMNRIEAYFGLDFKNEDVRKCRDDLLSSDNVEKSAEEIVAESINPALALLLDRNSLDIELYEYAVEVFNGQAELFREGGVHFKGI